jgi:hypothetical protein
VFRDVRTAQSWREATAENRTADDAGGAPRADAVSTGATDRLAPRCRAAVAAEASDGLTDRDAEARTETDAAADSDGATARLAEA